MSTNAKYLQHVKHLSYFAQVMKDHADMVRDGMSLAIRNESGEIVGMVCAVVGVRSGIVHERVMEILEPNLRKDVPLG